MVGSGQNEREGERGYIVMCAVHMCCVFPSKLRACQENIAPWPESSACHEQPEERIQICQNKQPQLR